MAARMASQISKMFAIQLPVRVLFDHPTVAQLSTAIGDALNDRNQVCSPSIRPVVHADEPPLSYHQERTWRHEKDSPRNLEVKQFEMRGKLQVVAFKQALNEIVRRHEVLRTTYVERNGVVRQVIAPPSPVDVPMFDLVGSNELQVQEAEKRLLTDMRRPLDLGRDSILRASLMQLGHHEYRFFLAIHHIACDGQSVKMFFGELDALYCAFSQGQASPLPPVAVQYADYAVWQRGCLNHDSEVYRRKVDYWKAKLTAAPSRLKLPRRFIKPFRPDIDSSQVSFAIPNKLGSRLITLGKCANTTLFATMLASFKAALRQCFGQRNILVGTYTGARTHPELAGLIGYFLNLLPLQTSLSGDPTFWELLARVRETTLDAYSHADLPFEELCAALRSAGHRLPDVRLIFDLKESEYEQNIAGVEVRRVRDTHLPVMPWGMTVRLFHLEESLSGFVIFDSNLYRPKGVALLVDNWMQLLRIAAHEPNRRLSEFKSLRRRCAA